MNTTPESPAWANVPSTVIIELADKAIERINAFHKEESKGVEERQVERAWKRCVEIAEAGNQKTFRGKPKRDPRLTAREAWANIHPIRLDDFDLQFFRPCYGSELRKIKALRLLASKVTHVNLTLDAVVLLSTLDNQAT